MASIQKLKRKDGTAYRVFIRHKGRAPITRVFESRRTAVDWARTMEGSADNLDAFPDAEARKHTLGNACDAFMAAYAGKDEAILGRLAWWKDHYGLTPLASFTQASVKEGLRTLEREEAKRRGKDGKTVTLGRQRTPATLNRYLAAVSIVLTWAVDAGWVARNPVAGIRRRKESKGRVRWLTEEERTALMNACDASPWSDLGLLVRLALSTGARQGELLGLRWADLDLKRGVARIGDSKSGEPRTLPILASIRERIEAKPRPIAGGLLFPAIRDPAQPMNFRPFWEEAVTAAKLENFRFHDLRHSCASYLAMNGASLLEIADVLGHKTLAMVKRYSHLSSDHKERLVARVFGDKVG